LTNAKKFYRFIKYIDADMFFKKNKNRNSGALS